MALPFRLICFFYAVSTDISWVEDEATRAAKRAGWTPVASSFEQVEADPWGTCLSFIAERESRRRCRVEVRIGLPHESFRVPLCDHGWQHLRFMRRQSGLRELRELLIIYLVEPEVQPRLSEVPGWAMLDASWKRIGHVLEPCQHVSSGQDIPEPDQDNPTISVITATFNGAPELEQTIQSVLAQDYSQLEFIIVDGASDDDSGKIIDRYRSHLSAVVSEPDTGVFNAMNKGWNLATGDYLLFLNSGDALAGPTVIRKAAAFATQQDQSFAGEALLVHPRLRGAVTNSLATGGVPHQAFFMSRKQFGELRYDETFNLIGDSELWDRFYAAGGSIREVSLTVAIRRLGGISLNPKHLRARHRQHERRGKKRRSDLQLAAIELVGARVPQSVIDGVWFLIKRGFR